MTTDICEPLQTLTSVKADWIWKKMYQDLYERVKTVKKDAYMKFYDTFRPVYLDTIALLASLRAGLLQVRYGMNCGCHKVPDYVTLCPIAFTNKNLSLTE